MLIHSAKGQRFALYFMKSHYFESSYYQWEANKIARKSLSVKVNAKALLTTMLDPEVSKLCYLIYEYFAYVNVSSLFPPIRKN